MDTREDSTTKPRYVKDGFAMSRADDPSERPTSQRGLSLDAGNMVK
jgi:hypothetical protein